jgi:O-methyltransferase involved in polyketide biosynthesis
MNGEESEHQPLVVDLERPSAARIYDWILGGTANWAIDREFGKKILDVFPIAQQAALANRYLLHRIVRHLVRQGVRQFVDIGSGVPTMGNVHQIADDLVPDSRVAYVDNEPVAVAHSHELLRQHGDPSRHTIVNADLRDPDVLWKRVIETGVIDPDQPIGLLIIAVLHFVTGENEGEHALARYRELLPPGSYLAISHGTDDGAHPTCAAALRELAVMYEQTSNPVLYRTREQIRDLFGDFELLEPGMCWAPEWHPEEAAPGTMTASFDDPSESAVWTGVARKS